MLSFVVGSDSAQRKRVSDSICFDIVSLLVFVTLQITRLSSDSLFKIELHCCRSFHCKSVEFAVNCDQNY